MPAGDHEKRRAQHAIKPLEIMNLGLHPTEIAQSGA